MLLKWITKSLLIGVAASAFGVIAPPLRPRGRRKGAKAADIRTTRRYRAYLRDTDDPPANKPYTKLGE